MPDLAHALAAMPDLAAMRAGEPVTALAARFVADLELYAGIHQTDFTEAVSASRSSYAAGLITHGGAFEPGCDTRGTGLLPVPAGAEPYRPVPAGQGVVITCSDAEWLLVRTEARIRHMHQAGQQPSASDIADRDLLAASLADAHAATRQSVLARLEPAVTERALDLEQGPAAAAALGARHGISGAYPQARPHEGEELLMSALGETEATSAANAPHRWHLISAYVDAYQHARQHPAASPARHARRDFPRDLAEFLPGTRPSALIRQASRPPAPGRRRPGQAP